MCWQRQEGKGRMKRTIEITNMTNAIVIWGNTFIFHYTNKPVNCNHCSLRGYCSDFNGVFGHLCEQFKDWRPAFMYGVFKKAKTEGDKENE